MVVNMAHAGHAFDDALCVANGHLELVEIIDAPRWLAARADNNAPIRQVISNA